MQLRKVVISFLLIATQMSASVSLADQQQVEDSYTMQFLDIAKWISLTAGVAAQDVRDQNSEQRLSVGLQERSANVKALVQLAIENNAVIGLRSRSNYSDADLLKMAFERRLDQTLECANFHEIDSTQARSYLADIGKSTGVEDDQEIKSLAYRQCLITISVLKDQFYPMSEELLIFNSKNNYATKYSAAIMSDLFGARVIALIGKGLAATTAAAVNSLPVGASTLTKSYLLLLGGSKRALGFARNLAMRMIKTLDDVTLNVASKTIGQTLQMAAKFVPGHDGLFWNHYMAKFSKNAEAHYVKTIDELLPTTMPDVTKTFLRANQNSLELTWYAFAKDTLIVDLRTFPKSMKGNPYYFEYARHSTLRITSNKVYIPIERHAVDEKTNALWHMVLENKEKFSYIQRPATSTSFSMPLEMLPRFFQDLEALCGHIFL